MQIYLHLLAYDQGMTVLSLLIITTPPAIRAEGLTWKSDFAAAVRTAKQTKRPVLVYFTTSWCGYCRVMERETFPDAAVGAQSARYIPVKLDAEKEGKELAKRFGVASFPNFLFLDGQEKLIAQFEGFLTAKEFVARIDQILDHGSIRAKIDRALKANPKDGKANAQDAVLRLGDGDHKQALAAIERSREAGYRGPELARALTEYGKLFARTNYAEAARYLEEAIALGPSDAISEAYDTLMMAALYGQKEAEATKTAERIVAARGVEPALKARAADFVRSRGYEPKLVTPEGVVDQLVEQLQGRKDRDTFYFRSLFMAGAMATGIIKSEARGVMKLDSTVDTWLESQGVDKLQFKLTPLKRTIDTRENAAHAWLEYSAEATLPSGQVQTWAGTLSIHMMRNGTRWYITTLVQQPNIAKSVPAIPSTDGGDDRHSTEF